MIVQNSRIQMKYSTIPGVEPTIPLSDDHTDGTWLPTDLYVGEVFLNSVDNLAWWRSQTGLIPFGATGSTGAFIGDFVPASIGGTYGGPVFGPEFNADLIVGNEVQGVTGTFTGPVSATTYYGDGSNLTGIVTTWNGGVVANPSTFQDDVSFDTSIDVDSITTSGLTIDGNVTINGDETVNGDVTAVSFIGDGSQLTGITGSTDTFTNAANLVGNTIQFNRNDLVNAYSVDLSTIAGAPVTDIQWDPLLNEFTLTLADGTYFPVTINQFNNLIVTGNVTADYFIGDGSLLTNLPTNSGPTGPTGPTGTTGATGAQGYRAVMNLSYTGSSLTLGLGALTLPIGTPINNLGWQEGTRIRVWHSATEYMEGQIAAPISNPQTSGIHLIIDYVVGSGTFVSWFCGIAGDLGSGSGGAQTLEQTLQTGNTIGAESINFGGGANIDASGTNIRLRSDGNVSGDLYLNSLIVADDFTSGIEQISFSDITGTTKTSNISLSPGQTYEAHTINDIVLGTQQTTVIERQTPKTVELIVDQSTGVDTEYRRELGVNGTTNGSLVKVTDNTALEETEIKTDKSTITLSSSAAAGQILANIGMTASEITYSIIDTAYYDPHYSAIGTIGTQYTSLGNDYISPNPGFPDFHRRGSVNTKSGPASGNETWAELRSETTDGSSYAYIRATDLGGAYPANVFQVGDIGSSQYTLIEQNYNQIKIESSNTFFEGIKYDVDWSANFVNRSLVDKEYVDNAISGGSQNLSSVLTTGNSSGNNNIVFNNTYGLVNSSGEGAFTIDQYSIDSSHFKILNGAGDAKAGRLLLSGNVGRAALTGEFTDNTNGLYSASVITADPGYAQMAYQESNQVAPINYYATLFQVNRDNLYVAATINSSTPNTAFKGIEYGDNYSANFTTRSLVDKGYVTTQLANKQGTLTLTTTGTSGAATLIGSTLNIPQYSGGGGGSQTLAQTLALGNSAGTYDINMNNNDITNVATVSANNGPVVQMINMTNAVNMLLMYNS